MRSILRVLVADDHRIIRESLSRFLNSQEGFLVIGKAADGREAVAMAGTLQPDLVLIDHEMPAKNGVEATREILDGNPKVIVIGFSMHDDGRVEKAMINAGAAAHVSKSRSKNEILATIRTHTKTLG